MRQAAGIAIMLGASASAAIVGGPLRERLPGYWVDALMALAGAGIGAGGLLMFDAVGAGSWIAAPALVALIALLHVRALFAGEGPFRT
jgi:hypothetical protein